MRNSAAHFGVACSVLGLLLASIKLCKKEMRFLMNIMPRFYIGVLVTVAMSLIHVPRAYAQ